MTASEPSPPPVLVARPKDHARVPRSERPEPPVPGGDLYRQRPEGARVHVSTQLMTWSARDADAVGLD